MLKEKDIINKMKKKDYKKCIIINKKLITDAMKLKI